MCEGVGDADSSRRFAVAVLSAGFGPVPSAVGYSTPCRSAPAKVQYSAPYFSLGPPSYGSSDRRTAKGLEPLLSILDPRMTRDQWVLILVCALAATWFAAILLFHPS
jgi:hypothetical protein